MELAKKEMSETEQRVGLAPVKLELPKFNDGKPCDINCLKGDQLQIACVVMKKLKEWVKHNVEGHDMKGKFKPMRMIVRGAAGTGKSILIKAIVTAIRSIFQHNDAVHVMAPTGAAAFNVLGQTIHRMLGINIYDADKHLSEGRNI